MEIYQARDAKTVQKEAGTRITYHFFDEYEINGNEVPPNSAQDWHYHKIKEEVVLIIKGSIDIEAIIEDKTTVSTLSAGDLVRLENTPHRFINRYKDPCFFVCFKLVLSGESKRDILAGDKYPVPRS